MSGCAAGSAFGDAVGAARVLPAAGRGRGGLCQEPRQARQTDHGETQGRETEVSSTVFDYFY